MRQTIGYPATVSSALPCFFSVAVDLVVLTIRDGRLNVLVVERGNPPFKHRFALPGGFVRPEEDLDVAAVRELQEETTLQGISLEQVRTYGAPGRDPRGRVASVMYLAVAPDLPTPIAGTDAVAAQWIPIADGQHLAFDHDTILRNAVDHARMKIEHTPIALEFCGGTFTITDLRMIYEVIWDTPLDPSRFHHEVTRIEGFIIHAGTRLGRLRDRATARYRRGDAAVLHPPLRRAKLVRGQQ